MDILHKKEEEVGLEITIVTLTNIIILKSILNDDVSTDSDGKVQVDDM